MYIVFYEAPFDPEWHKWEEKTTDDIIILLEENISWIRLSLQIYFVKLNIEIFILCYQLYYWNFTQTKVHRKKILKISILKGNSRGKTTSSSKKNKSQILKNLIIYCLFFIPFLQKLTAGVLVFPVNTQFPLSLLAKIWVSPAVRDAQEHETYSWLTNMTWDLYVDFQGKQPEAMRNTSGGLKWQGMPTCW